MTPSPTSAAVVAGAHSQIVYGWTLVALAFGIIFLAAVAQVSGIASKNLTIKAIERPERKAFVRDRYLREYGVEVQIEDIEQLFLGGTVPSSIGSVRSDSRGGLLKVSADGRITAVRKAG